MLDPFTVAQAENIPESGTSWDLWSLGIICVEAMGLPHPFAVRLFYDIHTYRHTDRHRHTNIKRYTESYRHTPIHRHEKIYRDIQTYTHRDIDIQTYKHKKIYRHIQTYTHTYVKRYTET